MRIFFLALPLFLGPFRAPDNPVVFLVCSWWWASWPFTSLNSWVSWIHKPLWFAPLQIRDLINSCWATANDIYRKKGAAILRLREFWVSQSFRENQKKCGKKPLKWGARPQQESAHQKPIDILEGLLLKMGIDRNSEPHHPIGQSTSFSPPSPPINTQTTTLPQKKEQIAKLCTLDSPFIKQEQKKTAPKNPGAPGAPQGHFECERQYHFFLHFSPKLKTPPPSLVHPTITKIG